MNGISFAQMLTRVDRCIRKEPLANNYTIEKEIGRGKFAVVKLVKDKQNNKQYAAKFIRKRRKGKCQRAAILDELVVHEMALNHSRLIHMYEVYETNHDIIIIMEYAVGGELFNHCAVDEPLTEKETQRLMRQILDGIAFLHDKNIVHLDIKPQNILLTKTAPAHGDIKLCDFSFAKQVNQGTDIRDILGTLDYVAPEILSYEPIKKATDMWSIGVLAYVMLTGHSPFLGETKQETFLNISQINVEYPDDLFKNISSNARDFIAKLLVKDPEDRPSATEMLSHVWLKTDELTTTTTQQQQQISSRLRSPCASPIGCRRPMPKVTLVDKIDVTPSKKYRYSEEKIMERPINGRCPLLVAPPSVA